MITSPTAPPAAAPPAAAAKTTAPPTAGAAPAGPSPSSAPAPAAGAGSAAPAGQAAAGATALQKDVVGLLESTKGIDAAWSSGIMITKAAVDALGKDAKLPEDAASAVSRMMFIGQVLGEQMPKDAKPVALPKGLAPLDAIRQAEQGFQSTVAAVAKQSMETASRIPKDAPKDLVQGVMLAQERVTDAVYAVKFSQIIAPPPAPAAAPAGKPGAPAAPTAAPAAPSAPPAKPAAPAPPSAPGK